MVAEPTARWRGARGGREGGREATREVRHANFIKESGLSVHARACRPNEPQ